MVGVGPKRKWLGQEKMLGGHGWVEKNWVAMGLGKIKFTIFKKEPLNRKYSAYSMKYLQMVPFH